MVRTPFINSTGFTLMRTLSDRRSQILRALMFKTNALLSVIGGTAGRPTRPHLYKGTVLYVLDFRRRLFNKII